jgi:hypothetical protein
VWINLERKPHVRTVLTALATLSFSYTLMAADPFVGTWKLNIAKSKLQGRDVASETMRISEADLNGYRTITDIVLKSGGTRHQEINRTLDGKEHPATGVGFAQDGATEINQQMNESTRKITHKVAGKVAAEINSAVSPDGKVMTNRRTSSSGEEVLVFEKQ